MLRHVEDRYCQAEDLTTVSWTPQSLVRRSTWELHRKPGELTRSEMKRKKASAPAQTDIFFLLILLAANCPTARCQSHLSVFNEADTMIFHICP